jgi:hypothetical protein
MIKSLNKSDILVTPFEANKNWNVNTLNPTDLILWMSQSIDPASGITSSLTGNISHIYIDYGDNNAGYNPTVTYPITNSYCNLALQQQSGEYVVHQRGVFNSSIIYPTASFYTSESKYYNSSSNPQNIDGTYMNIIYAANEHLFYNNYGNFTQTFGMENADLASTHRILTNTMEVFNIPQNKFGEAVVKNSVVIVDDSLDKEYTIVDDGNCNLIFSGSVFSKYGTNNLLNNLNTVISSSNNTYITVGKVPFSNTGMFYVTSSVINAVTSGGIAPYIYQWNISGSYQNLWTIISVTDHSIYLKYNNLINSYDNLQYQNTYVNCTVIDNLSFTVVSNNLNFQLT